jgi:HPt (histidine-containing phosphotransfer) domain-containing protein
MIDWTRIAELRDEIGPDDFGEVVTLFLEEVDEEIGHLRAGCDVSTLEARLHFLKGSALNLGFRDFAVICQSGESAAAAGDASSVDVPATLACYDASKAEFIAGLPLQETA